MMELWPFTNFHDLNLDWIVKTIKTYTKKVDDFIADIKQTWHDFRDWVSREIDQMHDDFAEYVNVTEGALNTGAIADGAITEPKINNSFLPKIENDYVTLEMFGAAGDGVVNDTTAFVSAINSGKRVHLLSDKRYKILDDINVPANTQITGDNSSTLLLSGNHTIHLEHDVYIEGFKLRGVDGCSTIFTIDDTSGTSNLNIYIMNVDITGDEDSPTEFSIFNIHSETTGFYGVNVRNCRLSCTARAIISYVARIYAKNNGWVSTCVFDGNYSSGFKWHYFFAESEALMDAAYSTRSEGGHIINNCVAQCSGQHIEEGFVYARGNLVLYIGNNMCWDWSGSNIAPYLINVNMYQYGARRIRTISNTQSINSEFFSLYDNGTYIREAYYYGYLNSMTSFEPAYENVPIRKDANTAARLIYSANSAIPTDSRIALVIFSKFGLYAVSITRTKVVVPADFPTSFNFYMSNDYKRVYISGVTSSTDSMVVFPGINRHMSTSYGYTAGASAVSRALSGNEFGKSLTDIFLDSLPNDVTQMTIYHRPTVVVGDNSSLYDVGVDTDGNLKVTAHVWVNEVGT